MVKKPPAKQVTPVLSLGQEDTLEKEMATQSSILDWRILWTEEPGGLQSMGSQRADTTQLNNSSNSIQVESYWMQSFDSVFCHLTFCI